MRFQTWTQKVRYTYLLSLCEQLVRYTVTIILSVSVTRQAGDTRAKIKC